MEIDGVSYTVEEIHTLVKSGVKEKERLRVKSVSYRIKIRMQNPVVYKLYVDGDDECYVGRTICIQSRLNKHFSVNNSCTSRLLINKHGRDKIKHMILEQCTTENQHDREEYWINNLKCVNISKKKS